MSQPLHIMAPAPFPATRMRRLRTLIAESAAGRRIGLLRQKDDPQRPSG